MSLLKDNHPTKDFFITDVFDNLGASFKDDIASMEHPIFVLSKNKDMRNLEYRKDNVSITIAPSTYGLPTIFDKDVLLYCMSLLMTEVNAGRTPPKTLRVSCHDLLVATNRRTDGDSYTRLKNALDRLTGVMIKTNIKTNKREVTKGFGLLESYEIVESSRVKNRMVKLEISLPDWLYNSVLGKEVLTINRNYFRLGKPMERRLYEIARKHCGNQHSWSIGLSSLMDKTGSTGTFRLFRSRLKSIAQDDHLPDYRITVADDDKVTFSQKHQTKNKQGSLVLEDIPAISKKTLDTVSRIVQDADTDYSFDTLQEEFTLSLLNGFRPDSVNGAFIAFVKKKVANTGL